MITGSAASGMCYAVKRIPGPVGYCSLSIRCGTRDEGDFHNGIAHFAEHTLFKGTLKKNARTINNYLDKYGGELNAFTTKEEIVLHATVLKSDLWRAAKLLMELAATATFPEKEIEIERGVVIDEINSYKDCPADDVYDKFEEALFEGHPLGRSILGTAASVKKITSDELRSFTDAKFSPGNMALALAADIDEEILKEHALTTSESFWDNRDKTSFPRELVDLGNRTPFNRRVDKRNHEVNAVIGNLAPSLYNKEERFSTILLSNILGGPASNSLLNDYLREKRGWVYGVESAYTQYSESGIIAINFGCDKSNLDRCIEAIWKVIRQLQEKPLSDKKLAEAKRQIIGQLAISSANGEAQCLSMSKSMLSFGTVFSDGENLKAIEAITSDQIQQTARKLFDPETTSSLIFL